MAREARGTSDGGVFMGREAPSGSTGGHVCFVCGNSGHSDQYWLRVRPLSNEPSDITPYFPFLDTHEPPHGYRQPPSIKQDSAVMSCYLCYSLLVGQWDQYERENVPARQRVYWLKRCDNGPFTGADLSTQGEYACHLLGLSVDYTNTNSHKDTIMSSAMSQITGEDSRGARIPLTPISTPSEHIVQQNGSNPIHTNTPHSNPGSYSSSSGTDILDLSMPDKNSSTEVCYVCGEEFRRGSLSNVSAKPPVANQAAGVNQAEVSFFPSLMLHPRPPRSRPMDSTGSVQTCHACHTHLLNQWKLYTSKNVPHGERNYMLRKRLIPSIDTSTFICFTCSLEYPSTSMRTLYCYPNNIREPYYPSLTKIKTPPGALPISPQGTVQVCAVCFKSVPQKHQVTMLVDLPVAPSPSPSLQSIKSPDIRFRPYDNNSRPNKFQILAPSEAHHNSVMAEMASNGTLARIMSGQNFRCYVCFEMCHRSQLEWIRTHAEGMNAHSMHFPCLKLLSRSAESFCVESRGRVLTCYKCVQLLSGQWNSMEANRVPLEHRRYNVPSLNVNGYNTQQTSSRNDISSIYCFLCNYQSDLTYARVLYSRPQGRNAPYFPSLVNHETNAERLRDDGSALVCTFCYHGYIAQWRDYESSSDPLPQNERNYNHKDYVCYVCVRRFGRLNIRSLAINDYPFLRYHRQVDQALLLENGECAVVCVECYETIHIQSIEYACFGMPLDKPNLQNTKLNFIEIKPEENSYIQNTPQNMTIDKTQINNQINKRKIKQPQTSSDNSTKRSTLNSNQCNSKTDSGLVKPQPTSSGSKRTVIPNLVGQAPPPPSPGGRSFAAALRNLAKQAGPSPSNSNDNERIESQDRHNQESSVNGRMSLPSCNTLQVENESKPMLNAEQHRSGFQPYKPEDQRSIVPTTVSAPSTNFSVNPVPYSPYHPANLYSPHFQHAFNRLEEQMYLERCGVPIFPSPSYHPHGGSPHPLPLYGLHHLQSPLVMSPNLTDRMRMDEDRLQRDRDMQEREKRDKAKQQQRAKNVQTSAADLSGRRH